jgi:Cu(I)/Ag(I) efflux system membrane fusion protein
MRCTYVEEVNDAANKVSQRKRIGISLLALNIVLFLLFVTAAIAQDHSGHSSTPAKTNKAVTQKKTPVVEETEQDVPKVEISAEQQKLIGVKTVQVALRPLQKVIRTVGKVEANEHNLATVNAKMEGWIEKLYVDVTGSYVKKGDPLVEIYSPELVASQRELLLALKWTKQSAEPKQSTSADINRMLAQDVGATLEAARQRLLFWDISEEQIKKIEETGKPIRTLTLYSPVNGFVTQKMVVSGMKVMPGEKIFDIADLSSLWVIADVYENELPLIKVGQTAVITLPYLPGRSISSSIDYIYPTISADTRTAKIRLKLHNAEYKLKPQMFANVEIKINMGNKLLIPESAVIDTGRGIVAYVDLGDGSFEPREIKAGLRSDGSIEVLYGLKAGEKVVSQANFLVDSEAQLKGIKPLPRK